MGHLRADLTRLQGPVQEVPSLLPQLFLVMLIVHHSALQKIVKLALGIYKIGLQKLRYLGKSEGTVGQKKESHVQLNTCQRSTMATFENISHCNFFFLLGKLLVFSMNEPRFTSSQLPPQNSSP